MCSGACDTQARLHTSPRVSHRPPSRPPSARTSDGTQQTSPETTGHSRLKEDNRHMFILLPKRNHDLLVKIGRTPVSLLWRFHPFQFCISTSCSDPSNWNFTILFTITFQRISFLKMWKTMSIFLLEKFLLGIYFHNLSIYSWRH